MASDTVIAVDFKRKGRAELQDDGVADPLTEATARLENQLLEEAKDAQREAELRCRPNPELVCVEGLHSGLEAQIAKAREMFYRLARYNFMLNAETRPKGPKAIEETVFLEQLDPWMPTEERFYQERLSLNSFILFENEDCVREFYPASEGQIYRKENEGRIYCVSPIQIQLVLANIRELIRVFEKEGESTISIQGMDYASRFFIQENGLAVPAIHLPAVYRSNSRTECPVKRILELSAKEISPTVSYRFK